MIRFIKEYFSLTNNEQRGLIGLLLIILFVFIGSRSYFMFQKPQPSLVDNSAVFAALYTEKGKSTALEQKEREEENSTIVYFNFDPNTINKEGLLGLGIKETLANTIINYRNKGGRFYKKEDLLKIYGLEQADFQKLEPYIVIPETVSWKKEKKVFPKEGYTDTKEKTPEPAKLIIELNDVDSASLTKIKGIGPVYAARIVKYRKLLGGFVEKEQLLEVYGIDREMYDKIAKNLVCNGKVTMLQVHQVSWKELAAHPYISNTTANILLNYIKAHGEIKNFDFILESQLMTEDELNKFKPYISLEK